MEFYLCFLFFCLLCLFCGTVLAVARILKPVKANYNNMDVMQSLVGRLRPLVGVKAWDYCVIWKLTEDQRFVRWVDCCCAGAHQSCIQNNGVEDLYFSTAPSCRDLMVQHPRTNSCELLAQLPSSIPLDSGIHAEALVSNQTSWLNFSSSSDCLNLEETISTKVLIPLPGGLVELFAAKQVPGDKNVIDFVTAQCNIQIGQDGIADRFSGFLDCMVGAEPEPGKGFDQKSQTDMFLKHEVSADQTGQYNPQMVMNPFNLSEETELREMVNGMGGGSGHHMDEDGEYQGNHEKEPFTHENGRSDSISYCSELNDDLEDDAKYGRKPKKGLPSKNLEAERKRRKKLNERLYTLRSLVPNISKLDRASILGDAIDYIKELLTQVKELQDELEENSGTDDGSNKNNGISQNRVLSNNNRDQRNGLEAGAAYNGKLGKQTMNQENPDDKVQEMEPQVEIALDGKECYVKVICEHKPGGFTRLMEALDSQGLEVTNANVTRFLSLVSNVFKVERKDNELVQAMQVRDFLLEITRNPSSSRGHDDPTTNAATDSNKNSMNYHHHCNGHC